MLCYKTSRNLLRKKRNVICQSHWCVPTSMCFLRKSEIEQFTRNIIILITSFWTEQCSTICSWLYCRICNYRGVVQLHYAARKIVPQWVPDKLAKKASIEGDIYTYKPHFSNMLHLFQCHCVALTELQLHWAIAVLSPQRKHAMEAIQQKL